MQLRHIGTGSAQTAACSPMISGGMYTRLYIMHNYAFYMYIYVLSDNYSNCQLFTFAGESRKIYPTKSEESRWDFSQKVESLSESRNRKSQNFT